MVERVIGLHYLFRKNIMQEPNEFQGQDCMLVTMAAWVAPW